MNFSFFRKPASDTTNRKIFRATLIVGLLALVARCGGMVKELIIARSFGRGDAVDAFLIAFILPTFVMTIGMNALGYALVPVFIDLRQRNGDEAAGRLFSSVMLLAMAVLLAIAVLLGLFASFYLPFLGHNFPPAKLELTRELLYLLLPWILFSGIGTLVTAVLNANEKFALPALAPLLTAIATILLVLFASRRWGVFTLAGGAVAGSFLEAMLLLFFLRKKGVRLNFRWHGLDANTRTVLAQFAPMLAGGILMGSTAVVDQAMAAMLPAGSVAALGYANKLIGSTLSLTALALSSATLPYFSRMVAANDWAGCRHTLKRYSMLIVGASVPFTLFVIAFSHTIVRIVYQRGAFSAADTNLVSWVQACYAIQVPFYICSMLFVRFIMAVRRNDVLMYVSGINLVLDIALNLVLMRVWQVAGIALSTSIMYIVAFSMVSIWSIRFLKQEHVHLLTVAAKPRQ
jgi:putative peptidoglycan lipid II flippase